MVRNSPNSKRFSHSVSNYTTLWLEEALGWLYVGARGAIFALNISNINDSSAKTINWEVLPAKRIDCLEKRGYTETDCFNYVRFLQRFNGTHLYTCGTYAFHPRCAYVEIENFTLSPTFEGKERCPYDPTVGYTGLIVDNNIYTATLYGFHGAQADIKRNFQKRSLRMDDSLPYSLNDVTFIDSVLVTESVNSSVGDDDKIYFFFTEKLSEENAFDGKPLVTRVARVCKRKKLYTVTGQYAINMPTTTDAHCQPSIPLTKSTVAAGQRLIPNPPPLPTRQTEAVETWKQEVPHQATHHLDLEQYRCSSSVVGSIPLGLLYNGCTYTTRTVADQEGGLPLPWQVGWEMDAIKASNARNSSQLDDAYVKQIR
ncbi:semaphorin-4G-like [Rhincodon typus]|uniref:semaphorin-4G-like n=1 Tax=Rhincodon typus TaxID=259920 RepID=UPI00202EEB12|nr:semaphorin-4G-like [Rhincodon typus]